MGGVIYMGPVFSPDRSIEFVYAGARTLHNDGEGEPAEEGALRVVVRGALRDVGEDVGGAAEEEDAHHGLEPAVEQEGDVQIQRHFSFQ